MAPSPPFPTASRTTFALWLLLLTSFGVLFIGTSWNIGLNQSYLAGPFILSRITFFLALMVSFVAAVVMRFSLRYMAFDSSQERFCGWLFLTALSGISLMLSDHLLLLFGSWGSMSFGIHHLLAHYRNNPVAQRAARKKFWFSRVGDAALLTGIFIIFQATHHWSLGYFLLRLGELPSATSSAVAWCVALAAIVKSAQFPFHEWLPETLDAPTPVSAIMHAGAINGGGALLLKFAPAIVQAPLVCLALSVVGCMTMVVGMRGLWSEPTTKGKLAWSTVAQMGFMTAECGAAAYAAAFLHILSHGIYKAEGFLRSGTLPIRTPATSKVNGSQLGEVAISFVACALVFAFGSGRFGHSFGTPTEIGMALVLSISIGQGVAAVPMRSNWMRPLCAMAVASIAVCVYAGLETFLQGLVPANPGATPVHWLAALLPGLTLAGLAVQFQASKNLASKRYLAPTNTARVLINQVKEFSNA